MTPSSRRHCGALLLALCGTATHAAASDSYPDDIERKLSLSELPLAPPSYTLCHSDDEGGAKSVVKPFGLSLMRAGATGGHLPSLALHFGWRVGVGASDRHRSVVVQGSLAGSRSGTLVRRAAGGWPLRQLGTTLGCGRRGSKARLQAKFAGKFPARRQARGSTG